MFNAVSVDGDASDGSATGGLLNRVSVVGDKERGYCHRRHVEQGKCGG